MEFDRFLNNSQADHPKTPKNFNNGPDRIALDMSVPGRCLRMSDGGEAAQRVVGEARGTKRTPFILVVSKRSPWGEIRIVQGSNYSKTRLQPVESSSSPAPLSDPSFTPDQRPSLAPRRLPHSATPRQRPPPQRTPWVVPPIGADPSCKTVQPIPLRFPVSEAHSPTFRFP